MPNVEGAAVRNSFDPPLCRSPRPPADVVMQCPNCAPGTVRQPTGGCAACPAGTHATADGKCDPCPGPHHPDGGGAGISLSKLRGPKSRCVCQRLIGI